MEQLTLTQARAILGPEPFGDPNGMRALAAQLRTAADLLDDRSVIRLNHWESPAGRRVRAAIDSALARASEAWCDLISAASLLEREADEVAAAKVRWEARYAELIEECSSILRTKP